ncbi:hypothetical protein [Thermoactinospora rubra]|uniref:hypothetical protein n=1 Tax=Thermoactinospora rubra TaxID=1088767 RepID=UPI000A10EB04|nr:hypothetical protein [Thermoactinospora rubra]
MLVVLAIAAVAVLVCVVLVSLGKGGELTEFPPDVPPLNLPEPSQLSAVDFMALQLPVNLVGYHTQSVDETLRRAASAISARDTRIAVLEQRVSELLASRLQARQEVHAAPGAGLRTQHEPRPPESALVLAETEAAPAATRLDPYGEAIVRPRLPADAEEPASRKPRERADDEAPSDHLEEADGKAGDGNDGSTDSKDSDGTGADEAGEQGRADGSADGRDDGRDDDRDDDRDKVDEQR